MTNNIEYDELLKFDREEQLLLGSPETITMSTDQRVFAPDNPPLDMGDGTLESDFEFARRVAREAMHIALSTTKSAKEIADQTNHPRMYEALNLSLANLSTATKDLLHIHKQKNDEIRKGIEESSSTSIPRQTNIQLNDPVFVGSTKDLLDMINGDKQTT